MNLEQLNDYKEWVGKSPEQILTSVKENGGWAKVFRKEFPIFAHQIRNYFNIEPRSLTRYHPDTAGEMMGMIQEKYKNWGFANKFKGVMALSGDAYKDELGRTWFQMSPAGTIYHWGGSVTWDVADGWSTNYLRGQDSIPIFKLVSPDSTGGSLETIIKNRGTTVIGEVGRPMHVADLVITDYHDQGSYNYAETTEVGLPAHEKCDVAPHKKYPRYYINPPDRFLQLSLRKLPERKKDGKLIGYEEGFEPFEFDTTRPDPVLPQGGLPITDPFGEVMAKRFPANSPGSVERVKRLEQLFQRTSRPKRLLARIESRRDKAARDFHGILAPASVKRLLKILRDRPQGGPKDIP